MIAAYLLGLVIGTLYAAGMYTTIEHQQAELLEANHRNPVVEFGFVFLGACAAMFWPVYWPARWLLSVPDRLMLPPGDPPP